MSAATFPMNTVARPMSISQRATTTGASPMSVGARPMSPVPRRERQYALTTSVGELYESGEGCAKSNGTRHTSTGAFATSISR